MSLSIRWSALMVVAPLALAAPLAAQQSCDWSRCGVSTVVTGVVPPMMRMSLDRSPQVVVAPSARQIAAGSQAVGGPTVRVKTNVPWRVQISSAQPSWTTAAGDSTGKPAEDLEWSTSPDGPFQPLSTLPTVAASGAPTAGTATPIYYRARYRADRDRPGTYTLAVQYTVTGT
ncbi:MAG TPA: hypothetical protein VI160_01650 [Gemmatimonadales bacterium]